MVVGRDGAFVEQYHCLGGSLSCGREDFSWKLEAPGCLLGDIILQLGTRGQAYLWKVSVSYIEQITIPVGFYCVCSDRNSNFISNF